MRAIERDGNEGVVLIFYSGSRCGCSLRAPPGEESCAAYRSVTRPVRDGAWRTVGDMDSNKEARCSTCCGRLPSRRALRPAASVRNALAESAPVVAQRIK